MANVPSLCAEDDLHVQSHMEIYVHTVHDIITYPFLNFNGATVEV